jgi:hypothetical protein
MFGRKGLSDKRAEEQAARSAAKPPTPEFPTARKIGAGLLAIGNGGQPPDVGYTLIAQFLFEQYKDERGVHVETLLNAVGALAGFAAQEAVWEGVVRPGKMPVEKAFVRIETKDGDVYYFGDFTNTILTSTNEGELSIWRIVAGAAVQNGAAMLPNLPSLFGACAKSLGHPQFGVPAWAARGALHELPWDALRHWPAVRRMLEDARKPPLHWPLEIACAAQILMNMTKQSVASDKAALIIMEAAIPMSKVDPRHVPGGTVVE